MKADEHTNYERCFRSLLITITHQEMEEDPYLLKDIWSYAKARKDGGPIGLGLLPPAIIQTPPEVDYEFIEEPDDAKPTT